MEFYATTTRKKLSIYIITWIYLKSITLRRKNSETKLNTLYDFTHMKF